LNTKNNDIFNKEWNQLIAKHPLRFDIWALLELHTELNVTQINHFVEQSKSTVARHLKFMEKDGLLISRIKETDVKGRIPPKIYQINPKFKKKELELEEISLKDEPQKLQEFYKKEVINYRKISFNIKKLLEYLEPLLDLFEEQSGDINKVKETYNEYFSYLDEPVFLYFDKKRSGKLIDIRTDYVMKLHKLAMEEDLNSEEAFVYFDISLPIAALFDLKKKIKTKTK
jgi:predicted transcriptional regulator